MTNLVNILLDTLKNDDPLFSRSQLLATSREWSQPEVFTQAHVRQHTALSLLIRAYFAVNSKDQFRITRTLMTSKIINVIVEIQRMVIPHTQPLHGEDESSPDIAYK